MELNYEEDIKIDDSALDVEWLEQAALALKYAKHVAILRRKVQKLEEKKKTLRSELILKVNKDPVGCCNKEKPNASDIEAYYRANGTYKGIVDELVETQYELEFSEFARSEIAFTRKAALENLVKLHGQNYFAGPSVPRDLTKESQEMHRQREVNKKIKINRK